MSIRWDKPPDDLSDALRYAIQGRHRPQKAQKTQNWRDVWSYAPVIECEFHECLREIEADESQVHFGFIREEEPPKPFPHRIREIRNIYVPNPEEACRLATVWIEGIHGNPKGNHR